MPHGFDLIEPSEDTRLKGEEEKKHPLERSAKLEKNGYVSCCKKRTRLERKKMILEWLSARTRVDENVDTDCQTKKQDDLDAATLLYIPCAGGLRAHQLRARSATRVYRV